MPVEPDKKNNQNNKEYERLIRDFCNITNAIAIYPPGHPMVENQLKKLDQKLAEILKTNNLISIHRGEGILVVNDIQVLANTQAMEKIIRHFDNFKITDLEITQGINLEELRNFLDIFAHSEESAKMYTDLNTACEKNQISHIKSLQAAYIRVPKNVTDKLGGTTVGELKISQEEMQRLIAYLKGEINLAHPKETKIYQKVFKKPELISSVVDKILIDNAKESPEKRKKMVIVVLNQVGKYLAQTSSSANSQKSNIKLIDSLNKALNNSPAFIALGPDQGLKNEVNQTVENIKTLIKNQALIAEYTKHKDKLKQIEEKLQKISPQLVGAAAGLGSATNIELKKILKEIKDFLEKIAKAKTLTPADIEKINQLLADLKKYLN